MNEINTSRHPSIVLSENSFDQLKSNFQPPLLSRRRLSAASNVYDLMTQLHKQHQLNIEQLNCIKQHLNSHEQHTAVDNFRSSLPEPPTDNYTNLYAEERLNSNVNFLRSFCAQLQPPPPPTTTTTTTLLESSFDRHKHRIYKIVADDIGLKWQALGRELRVKEGEMDRIHERHRDIHSKMFAIFELFEERTDCNVRSNRFCDALVEVRRRDLAKQVSHILMS